MGEVYDRLVESLYCETEHIHKTNKKLSKIQEDIKTKNNMAKKADAKLALKGLDDNTVVHCESREQAEKVCMLAEKAGLTQITGKSYSSGNKWEVRGAKTCYNFSSGVVHSLDYFVSEGFTILKADKFIELNSAPKIPNVELTPEQYSFNLDRLAKETDSVVKQQLNVAKENLRSEASGVASEVIDDLIAKVSEVKVAVEGEFLEKVTGYMNNSKEMLLEELRKGRTIINVGTGPVASTYSVSSEDHYMMETVFKSILLHKKIMLAGEAGKD